MFIFMTVYTLYTYKLYFRRSMPDLTSVEVLNPPNPNPEMFIFSLAQEKNRTATAIKYLINI